MTDTSGGFDPQTFLASVGEGKTITRHRAREVIFKQGTKAGHVFYLQSGRAVETVEPEQGGRDAVVGMLDPGLFFGTSAIDGEDGDVVRVSTVTAVTACTVTAITADAMKAALREPKFAQVFMAYLLHHNSKIEAEKVDLLFNSSEKRLMRKLLMLAHVTDGPAQEIGTEITQEMLANMIGTTRPRVNHFLNKFRKLGFIKYNGGIKVMPSLLKAVLQETPSVEDRK